MNVDIRLEVIFEMRTSSSPTMDPRIRASAIGDLFPEGRRVRE